jgi:AcrR family transcriptional regulator
MDNTPEPDSTPAEILRAAQELFVRQGYHGTSMRQIASQADIALGGIYNHFPGKEAIFREVFWQAHPYREVLPALEQSADEGFEALVRAAAARMVAALDQRPDFINLVLIEIVEFNSQHLGEIFLSVYPAVLAGMQHLFRSDDKLRPIPVPILMRFFIGLFFSYYMTEKMLGNAALPPEFSENAMDQFVEVFLHGILKPAADTD